MSEIERRTGLNGDWSGSCVICRTPTDTAIKIMGPANGIVVGLKLLGLPTPEAARTVRSFLGPNTRIPADTVTTVRVCTACCAKADPRFTPALAYAGADLPVYDLSDVP